MKIWRRLIRRQPKDVALILPDGRRVDLSPEYRGEFAGLHHWQAVIPDQVMRDYEQNPAGLLGPLSRGDIQLSAQLPRNTRLRLAMKKNGQITPL